MAIVNCGSYDVCINESWELFREILNRKTYSKVGVLVDENTLEHCFPTFQGEMKKMEIILIQIKSGEKEKQLETCKHIWNEMLVNGFDRHSVLINLGGGVIGDMGGFCASTFMRGIDFIQIPTTLLSQVDASVGGKLGVDFQDFKNLVGVFNDPQTVWIHTDFLSTLDPREVRSGYAEIIKHALIRDAKMWVEINQIESLENLNWAQIVHRSVQIKRDVVQADKFEGGLRKILNFGHTLGHSVETENLHKPDFLLHGEAISIGMITEAYLSMILAGLSEENFNEIKEYILKIFPHYVSQLENEEQIIHHLIKDKKNRRGMINFSLLNEIGNCAFDIVPEEKIIREALSDYRNN